MTGPVWLIGAPNVPLAACARSGTDLDAFFAADSNSPNRKQIIQAKEICASCVEQEPCLTYAVENNEEFGIWGGLTSAERRALQRRINKEKQNGTTA